MFRIPRELRLSNLFTHSRGRRHTAGDHLQHVVDVVCSTPLLVKDDIDAVLYFWLLYEIAVGFHTLLSIVLCEGIYVALVQVYSGEKGESE